MLIINAIERKEKGKSASRRLRNKNYLPAIIYGNDINNISVSLDLNIIMNLQSNVDFYEQIITLILNGIERKVKVKEIQRHPFKTKITHIDFVMV
ncbi:50S ribosomal protein L25 [Candidatus Pantoea edessiphila]|uniref:Large ribosomal subunit protein bL25 n=1 Tax=Candidatus Pantoea edessiphila TaxID=2044610 RepID=A0A2P5SYN9_9GAMM|nr:50S ribosomal protein L25 [Candidatus Pantoea edessiphila]MBK4775463.1 50S ribosomal protein L25 [Pantoea sp. Edef]PPI87410.1 50S ribosomal protein L25 [Candidatus Pantoea edessiphila]